MLKELPALYDPCLNGPGPNPSFGNETGDYRGFSEGSKHAAESAKRIHFAVIFPQRSRNGEERERGRQAENACWRSKMQ